MKDVYTYLAGHLEYPTLDGAKAAYPQAVCFKVRAYDLCAQHGDSLIAYDEAGREIVEIKCLMNHNFCSAEVYGETCGYEPKDFS